MTSNYSEKTISEKIEFTGNIITVKSVLVELPNGNKATRDIVNHPGAAAIVPISKDKKIFLVRQYRKALEQHTIEIPAGKLDSAEDPLVCAKRELKEETGLTAGKMQKLTEMYSTAGFCDEVLHIYLATDLEKGKADADDDEFLNLIEMSLENAVAKTLSGEIKDSKTIIGIMLAEKYINKRFP